MYSKTFQIIILMSWNMGIARILVLGFGSSPVS